jgi:hypothetical protein
VSLKPQTIRMPWLSCACRRRSRCRHGGTFSDHDGNGFALSSLNLNLRVVGMNVGEALISVSPQGPPKKVQAFTFFVSMGDGYVQVAQYQGRSFLRDGYHRAAGLLRANVSRVPAVVIDAPSYQFITPAPGLFDHEIAFSDHAPRLTDFWDDSVSVNALQRPVRKVVRIRAEVFVVPG